MAASSWILLRGLCRESRHWGDFLPLFRSALAAENVYALDLPGVGERYVESSPSRIEDIVESVRSEAVARGIPKPYSFFAVSLGAMVALKWVELYEEEVQRYVVVNTSDRQSGPLDRLRRDAWGKVLKAMVSRDSLEREQAILSAISNSPERSALVAPLWARLGQEHPIKYQVAMAQLLAARGFRLLRKTKVDGTFLVSLGDRFVDPKCSMRMAQYLNRPILTHSWGGHDLTLDDPRWVTDRVVELVAK